MTTMKFYDVVLFAKYNFHLSCLSPISVELTKLDIDHLLTTKRYQIYDMCTEHNRKIKIFVMSDEWIDLFRTAAEIIITTGHSLASKNTTFNQRNVNADYICATSEWQKEEFSIRSIRPRKEIWTTGYPAADRILLKKLNPKSNWSNLFYDNGKKNILFAPTYNRDLNFMDNLVQNPLIFEKLQKYNVAFKLHPVLIKKYPEYESFLLDIVHKWSNVFWDQNSHGDISDAILWADTIVGDCSGALFLSLAKNIPIVAFNNPRKAESPYFDPIGPEWIFRDEYAYTIDDMENLFGTLEEIFNIDWKNKRREGVRNTVFGNSIDGLSAMRIARNIRALL